MIQIQKSRFELVSFSFVLSELRVFVFLDFNVIESNSAAVDMEAKDAFIPVSVFVGCKLELTVDEVEE